MTAEEVRALLLRRSEVVIADVREEAAFATGHPLWAASFPLSRLELDAWRRIPRRDTPIAVYGDGVARAIGVLRGLGYTRVHELAGGLDAWTASGGEIFQDVNAPSKAFGELVASVAGTPSLTAQDVKALIDAGLPNPVAALRDGTIGWTLAGQRLDRGATRTAPLSVTPPHHALAASGARAVAERAGVTFVRARDLPDLRRPDRTTYIFDVRTAAEYARGHLDGARHAPGGQLVQETDHHAPVRGARIVVVDDDGVRAAMTGSWLAQMGWEVYAVSPAELLTRPGAEPSLHPAPPPVDTVDAATLRAWLADGSATVIDVGPSRDYAAGHIPGAWYAARALLPAALATIGAARRYVLTSPTGLLARFATADLRHRAPAFALEGGTAAWRFPLETAEARYAVPPADRYRRPYEGTDNPREAMEAYLEWEFGLVEQLERDGTHHFQVLGHVPALSRYNLPFG
ncbi:rhodanese-like domain-containing protein [Nonomuraea sp. NPDC049504]|uniref:rhodanese-like domain-containing protein n=1 Tax=Nonomuraea sp. NPDC049504 TaxID=3154729 RepID=UPI00342CCE24